MGLCLSTSSLYVIHSSSEKHQTLYLCSSFVARAYKQNNHEAMEA
jgi:hypothetical protein